MIEFLIQFIYLFIIFPQINKNSFFFNFQAVVTIFEPNSQ